MNCKNVKKKRLAGGSRRKTLSHSESDDSNAEEREDDQVDSIAKINAKKLRIKDNKAHAQLVSLVGLEIAKVSGLENITISVQRIFSFHCSWKRCAKISHQA